jgi:hypothetical protein
MTTIWCPEDLVGLIDQVKVARRDPRRAYTVRWLLLKALADLGYLEQETIRALGLAQNRPSQEAV